VHERGDGDDRGEGDYHEDDDPQGVLHAAKCAANQGLGEPNRYPVCIN
jgi:hypothetical protein